MRISCCPVLVVRVALRTMIDPQVEQGGASSWFCIAANDAVERVELTVAVGSTAAGFGAGIAADAALLCASITSSRLLTPARNCASGDRNFDAIQRKM